MHVRRSHRWRTMVACAALATTGAVVAGCGDDEGSEPTAGKTTAQAAAPTFTGDPVTVYFQAPIKTKISDNSDALAAVKAGARAINAAGGLNGSELKVTSCNDTDANAELDCVRKATSADAAAFVGSSFVFNPKAGQDALKKAGIPSVAPLAIQQVEYGNPINFPIYTTSFGILACPQQITEAVGAKKISSITQDLPVQKELQQTLQGVAGALKLPYGKSVSVPVSQTDFSAPVKQLADAGTDAVVDILAPPTQPAFFTALRSVGQTFKGFCGVPSIATYATLKQLGEQADSFYMSSGLPATNAASAEKLPLVQQFREEMTAAADAGDGEASLDKLLSPGNAFNAWLGTQVLKQVVEGVNGNITSKSLLAALNKAKVDLSGAGLPPLDFSKPIPAPGFERLFNPIVQLTKWDSGEKDFVATDVKPANVLEIFGALQAASKK